MLGRTATGWLCSIVWPVRATRVHSARWVGPNDGDTARTSGDSELWTCSPIAKARDGRQKRA